MYKLIFVIFLIREKDNIFLFESKEIIENKSNRKTLETKRSIFIKSYQITLPETFVFCDIFKYIFLNLLIILPKKKY